ncbi:hypothetical protein GPM19_10340 [Halomonas sp. ZH2S]|uniref:Uncharacterized protein n=1 Tax=Vreelandella zhuhanensis TaxID=2684210 RepID=A0A7X3H1Q7_9GAMM|nr:hypothetical protein [Halomonas zhuhanensis]MWJ28599.1 hypothetical protein [Halomonas zhuhanensis]
MSGTVWTVILMGALWSPICWATLVSTDNKEKTYTQHTTITNTIEKGVREMNNTLLNDNAETNTGAAAGATNDKAKIKLGRKRKVDHEEVIKWRLDNKASKRMTAEHFGVNPRSVQMIWSKAGLSYKSPVPSGGASFRADWKAIADYRKTHKASSSVTAKTFGVSQSTVVRACREYGAYLG